MEKPSSGIIESTQPPTDYTYINTKAVLTCTEAAIYLGMKKRALYILTHTNRIPYYKPMGKIIYFSRRELEEWMLQRRIDTIDELNARAEKILGKNYHHE